MISQLRLHSLPGPDTQTKQEALQSTDQRYLLMLAEVAEVGWPVAWSNDVYIHDRRRLSEHPDEPMIWILRDTGSSLVPVRCFNKHERRDYLRLVYYYSGHCPLNYFADENPKTHSRFYEVTANRLDRLTWEQAQERFITTN